MNSDRKIVEDLVLVFILLIILFGYFYQEGGWNANSRFSLIYAIVRERSLTIDHFVNNDRLDTKTGDFAFYKGHYYSDKAIGPAILGSIIYAPIYWLQNHFQFPGTLGTKWIITFILVGIPSAFSGSLMFLFCYWITGNRLKSHLVTISVTLGTLYFPYSLIFFSHQLTTSLLFSAFFLAFFHKKYPGRWKDWHSFLFGSLLGWSAISEYPSVLIGLPLAVYYLINAYKVKKSHFSSTIILPIAGACFPILLQLIYNKICFGGFHSIGYNYLEDPIFQSGMQSGLMGINRPNIRSLYYMTLHPLMGVMWQSPVLILSIFGLISLLGNRHYTLEIVMAVFIISTYFLVISGYFIWWGGWAVGPRHIIPTLPFFCILLCFVPKKQNWILIFLVFISFAQMMITSASTVLVPDSNIPEIGSLGFFKYSNIYDFCLQQLTKSIFTPNLGSILFNLSGWRSLLPLAGILILVIMLFILKEILNAIHIKKRKRW